MRTPSLPLLLFCFTLSGCDQLLLLLGHEPTREEEYERLVERAKKADEGGELDKAEQLYLQAAGIKTFDSAAQAGVARVYALKGRDEEAIFALKRAAELDPGDPEVHVSLAELLLRHGQEAAALEQLGLAQQKPEGVEELRLEPEVRRRLARALLRVRKVGEAEALAGALFREDPKDAQTLSVYAEVAMAQGDEGRAVRLLEAALAQDAHCGRAHMVRARYLLSRGKVPEALNEYEIAAGQLPFDADLRVAWARALAAANRAPEAVKLMEDLVTARPTDLLAAGALAEIKLLSGDLQGALRVTDYVLSGDPSNARALYVRARAVEGDSPEDKVRVINAYKNVLEADPMYGPALSRLWPLYKQRGQKTEAIGALEHLVILGEATKEEEVELARLYAQTHLNADRGLRLIKAAMQREPSNKRYGAIKQQLDAAAKKK